MHSDQPATQLLNLASAHQPYNDLERSHQDTIVSWLASADDPFNRNVFEPGHATGSGFIVSDDKRAALIFHSNLRFWAQPGGHAEAGETDVRSVAARESSEELGIKVNSLQMTLFDLDVHEIPARGELPAHLHFDFRFIACVPEVDLDASSDAESAGWFTSTEIDDLHVDASMLRMVDKAVRQGSLT